MQTTSCKNKNLASNIQYPASNPLLELPPYLLAEYSMNENLPDKLISTGFTFDDVLIAPRYSSVVPSEVEVQTRLTARIAMHVPILSSPMDTVTEAAMAIGLAQEGGLGVIHKNMSIERQTRGGRQGEAVGQRHHRRSGDAAAGR